MADKYYTLGGIIVGTNFQIGAEAPIDARFVVESREGLNDGDLKKYEGLISYVKDEKTYYQYTNGAWKALAINSLEELKALIASESTAAMEFKGAITNGLLPTAASKGDMYKIATNNLTIPAANNAEQTAENVVAKPGDSIVYEGENKWYLIPSGDDIEDTWRPVKVGGNFLAENETLEFVAGNNVHIAEVGGNVVISAQDTNTHYEAKAIMGNSNADVVDETAENGEVYFNIVENGEVRSSHKIVGTGGISVKFDAAEGEDGQNTITIEAAEGAKYDLAANKSATNGNVGLSLTGTDNSTDTVTIKGTEGITVTTDANGVVVVSETISAGLGDLASKDEVSLEDFDDALTLKATEWSTAAATVAAKETYWGMGAQTAATALQAVEVLGTTLKQGSSVLTVSAAKTALGLGTAAYESKDSFVATTGSQIISGIKTFENGIELNRNKGATLRIETSSDGIYAYTPSHTVYDDHCISVQYGDTSELHYRLRGASSSVDGDLQYADENYNVTIATREFVAAQGYLTSTDISGKVDKVATATNDNIPIFTAFGNLKDSGKSFNDLAWASDFASLSTWKDDVMDGSESVAMADQASYATNAGYSDNSGYALGAGNADTLDEMHASDFATAAQGSTADSALQSVKVLGHTLTKADNEITVAEAKTALGLKDAAYTTVNALNATAKGYADAVQGSTTNTVKDCVDAINTMNNKTGEVIGTVENIVSQLTWGTF